MLPLAILALLALAAVLVAARIGGGDAPRPGAAPPGAPGEVPQVLGAREGTALAAPRLEPADLAAPGASDDSAARVPLSVETVGEGEPGGAPLRARLVDARTGEPVAGCAVQLHRGELTERVTSDAEGGFLGRVRFGAGRLSLWILDHPASTDRDSVRLEHDPERMRAGEEVVVELDLTPVYLLDVRWPAGASHGGVLEAVLSPRTEPPRRDLADERCTRVRAGDPPWVRFLDPLPDARSALVLRTPDGLWAGWAEVSTIEPPPAPVRVEMHAFGALEVVALEADGEPSSFVDLELRRADAAPAADESRVRVVHLRTHANGAERARYLEPGSWTLVTLEKELAAPPEPVRIEAGRVTRKRLHVGPIPIAGRVSGTLTSASGLTAFPGEVSLRSVGEPAVREVRARVAWTKPAGIGVGRFVFDDVPAGTYEIAPEAPPTAFVPWTWDPPVARVEPPCTGLALRLLDRPRTLDLGFVALDALTGQELERVRVRHRDEDHVGRSGEVLLESVSNGGGFGALVDAPGYEGAEIGADAFDEPFLLGGRWTAFATVELERGWKLGLVAFGEPAEAEPDDGRHSRLELPEPLEVRVTAAGRSWSGKSVELALETPPAELLIEADDYRPLHLPVVDGRVIVDTERGEWESGFSHGRRRLAVKLSREDEP